MKQKTFLVNTVLAVLMTLAVAAYYVSGTFVPGIVIPKLSIPVLGGMSLLALMVERYLNADNERTWAESAVAALLGGITLVILPLIAGFVPGGEVVKLLIVAVVVCFVCDRIYLSLCDRLRSGKMMCIAPALAAGLLFLALQAFEGIIL